MFQISGFFKVFLVFSVLSLGSGASAQVLQAQIQEDQPFTIYDRTILFLGHTTSFWDGANTEAVVRGLIRQAQRANIPVIATVAKHMALDPELSRLHYFDATDIDWLVYSRAGQHSLILPNVEKIIVVGGNLGRCLCEGIRDLARGLQAGGNQSSKVKIFLIRDGIYDGYPPFSPMRFTHVRDFVQNFFVPSFKCPLQNWNDKERLILSDLRLDLFFNNSLVETFDFEPDDSNSIEHLNKTIEVHFVNSSDSNFYLDLKLDQDLIRAFSFDIKDMIARPRG